MSKSDDRESSASVAREAEDLRAGLSHTLGQLRDNLKPENVIEEVVNNARIGASTIADRIQELAHRNPISSLLIGAGASLFMSAADRTSTPPRGATARPGPEASPDNVSLSGRTSERIGYTMTSNVQKRARPVQSGTSRFSSLLNDQPLIIAALGVAVGAAIGAALPTTQVEDEWMGSTSSSLRHAAQEAAQSEIDGIRQVASRTADHLKQTVADHGVSQENVTGLVRDVGQEARSALDEIGNRFNPAAPS